MKRYLTYIILVLVTAVIIGAYYGFPVAYDRYITQQQPDMLTGFVDSSWSVSSGNSIHDTKTDEYQSLVATELPKLTKQTSALLDLYNEDKDPKYLFDLVASLTDDGAYYTAIYLYQILLKEYPIQAKYPDYLKLLLNRGEYTPQFLTEYQTTIDTLVASGLITNQDGLFFTSFRTLISGDVDAFYQIVHQLSGDYAPIASDLLANLTTYSAYKQAPQQYLWWLFASTLLRHGYYAPAIHLAQQSLKLNPDYTLGLQIMAYGRLMTHDRDQAKSYLTQLMKLDVTHLITYQRLYGIASYRDWQYTDTIQYLAQVQEEIPNIELLRYIGLSYRELQDYSHLATIYRSILQDSQVDMIDYFEFFDTYRRSISYTSGMIMSDLISPLDQYDNSLLSDYIVSCTTTMVGKESYLCDYGRAIQSLFTANLDQAMEQMVIIARDHPYDFIYGMIWDLYIIKDQLPTAQIYYQKAILSSYNGWYQHYLSNKIKSLTVDGSKTN